LQISNEVFQRPVAQDFRAAPEFELWNYLALLSQLPMVHSADLAPISPDTQAVAV